MAAFIFKQPLHFSLACFIKNTRHLHLPQDLNLTIPSIMDGISITPAVRSQIYSFRDDRYQAEDAG